MILIFLSLFFNNSSIDFLTSISQFCISSVECFDNNYIVTIQGADYDEVIDLFNVEVCRCNVVSNRLIIEGYTNMLSDYYVVDGVKTNIQMSVFDDLIMIGYPLLKCSF